MATAAETLVPDKYDATYQEFRKKTDLREPYRCPPEALKDIKGATATAVAESPLIAFVNPGSGGLVGPKLTKVLSRALGSNQVYNVREKGQRPDQVLKKLWANLEEMEKNGDARVTEIKNRLKIVACGGDGTVAWVLKTIKVLQLDPEPAVSVMPLGTGNDLSRTFKWGPSFNTQWIKDNDNIYEHLKKMSDGQYCNLDAWKVKITVPSKELIDELPVSLSKPDGLETVVEGIAWNYVSIGMDAEAAYRFHHIRETKPYLASTRMLNQMWYGLCGCRAGWFCCPRALNNKVKLEILTADNKYEEVKFPNSVKAMVLVNLQSYAGGRNIFGKKLTRRDKDKGMKDPAFDDGMIEVIGLKHGIHTGFVLTGMAHGERIAQCRGARLEVKAPKSADGEPGRSFMQLDGEPWPQKIPSGEKEDPLVMEMTLDSKSRLLMNLDGKPMERPEGASKL